MLDRFRWSASRWRPALGALLSAGVVAGAVTSCGTSPNNKEKPMTSQRPVVEATTLMADLATVSRTRVFFGHQSVGMNILEGVSSVYAAHGMTAPPIGQGAAPGQDGGFIDHAFIGENGRPLLKIQDFAAKLRAGLGEPVDVAMMKLCYVDITSGTDVPAVFDDYRNTMAALQREFPRVTFIHATVPLTTEPGLLSKVKSLLTGRGGSAADNAARERFNALIGRQFAGDHLFDLAAAESTAPDGGRVTGTYDGQRYYALYDGYAADPGHLNAEGASVVATAWLTAIAQAPRK
jgi:hypothetical protein